MSAKIKRQILHETFPNIDKTMLNEMFDLNDQNLEDAIADVNRSLGRTSPIRDVMTKDYQRKLEESYLQQAKQQSLEEQQAVGTNSLKAATYNVLLAASHSPIYF